LNGTFQGFVFCLDADSGHVQWQKGLGTDSAIESCPNVDDFDCDGQLEVVVAQWMGDCRVYCLNAVTGDVEWYSDAPGDYMYHGGSFADVDDDGLPEVAIGSYDGNVYLINGEDGSTEWSFPATAYACGPTSISDLDSDGLLEVFYATGSGVGTISSDGSGIWSIPTGGSVFRGAAVTDIDGDTIPDVLYGTSAGMLFARRGSAGELLWEIDLQAHYGDTYDIDHAPVTGDFDSDGSMDVFVVGGYGTSSAPEDNHGRAYMISAGPASGQVWPMFRHDLSRSGYYPWESTGVQEVPPALPEIGITCLPNPCSGSCTIQIEIQETTPASVILYDLAGRTVQMVRLLELESGVNSLSLDLEDLSTGTYLLRAESPSGCAVSRLVILE
jgi:outer membrane protein assembly factor BamB